MTGRNASPSSREMSGTGVPARVFHVMESLQSLRQDEQVEQDEINASRPSCSSCPILSPLFCSVASVVSSPRHRRFRGTHGPMVWGGLVCSRDFCACRLEAIWNVSLRAFDPGSRSCPVSQCSSGRLSHDNSPMFVTHQPSEANSMRH